MKRPLRVAGHSLVGTSGDASYNACDASGRLLPGGTPLGWGFCHCGAHTETGELGPNARRRWHRRHREQVARVPWL